MKPSARFTADLTADSTASTTKLESLLFDLDGTLVDSERIASWVLDHCFRDRWGIELQKDDRLAIVGRTWSDAWKMLSANYTLPCSWQEAQEILTLKYREEIQNSLPEIPGSAQAVRSLARNHRLVVVSGSFRQEIEFALTRLGIRDCFEGIVGNEDYERGKPHPEPYLLALERFGMKKETSLIFEDSWAGVSAAKAAGIRVIAITEGHRSTPQDVSHADEILTNFEQVNHDWLRNWWFSRVGSVE